MSVSIYTSSNAFVLGLFTNNTMVGYYSIAEKLYQALQGLYHPVIQTVYPYFSKTKNIVLFKRLFYILVGMHLLAFILLFNFSNDIFYLLFKLKHVESNKVFMIFLFSSLLHIPAILLGYPFLAAFGFPKYANVTVILSSIFHLFGLTILAVLGLISIYNIAVMVVLTEATVFFSRIYYSKKANLILGRSLSNE